MLAVYRDPDLLNTDGSGLARLDTIGQRMNEVPAAKRGIAMRKARPASSVGGTSAAGLNLAGSNSACGGSCNFSELGALGFVSAGTFENVATNSFQTINTSTTGRYVLIAGKEVTGAPVVGLILAR